MSYDRGMGVATESIKQIHHYIIHIRELAMNVDMGCHSYPHPLEDHPSKTALMGELSSLTWVKQCHVYHPVDWEWRSELPLLPPIYGEMERWLALFYQWVKSHDDMPIT